MGLDRHRGDVAGQVLTPVPELCSTTVAGLARRISEGQWIRVETGVAAVSARMLARLGAARRAALLARVTSDLDTTDVEVYGRHKQGVATRVLDLHLIRQHQPQDHQKTNNPSWRSTHRATRGFGSE